jgi:hypothetical protein
MTTNGPDEINQATERENWRAVVGWIAVVLSTLVSSGWAFWGAIENFHEGWHLSALWKNLALSLGYLSFMLISIALTLVALRWPRIGATILLAVGTWFCYWIYSNRPLAWSVILSWIPLCGLLPVTGVLYWFGRPRPKRWAYRVAVGVPVLIAAAFSAEPAWRVAGRIDDGNRETRLVEGNGVRLVWAPAGPGWPSQGVGSWAEAQRICRHLSSDGLHVLDEPQEIWRLPTVDEAVRSMARHSHNCRGVWDPTNERAIYETKPDKESPLWDVTSQIIYWWTATEANPHSAYMIIYDGRVYAKPKSLGMGSLAFRAVKGAAE